MHYVCMHHKDGDSTAFISLDGNFRLCRRKNAGQQSMYEKPLCGDRVFVNQSDVDCYVQSSSSLLVNLGRDSESNKVYTLQTLIVTMYTQFSITLSVMNSKQAML